jgi:hypothetical protein
MELHAHTSAPPMHPADGSTHAVAGVLAGLVAAVAYLAAQTVFAATIHGGSGLEPLHRIGAVLLGDDVLPPPAPEFSATIAGIALLIHFGLAMVYGRMVDTIVRGRELLPAMLRGGLFGLVLYAVNYWVIAPVAFPWFAEGRGATTVLDHVLFGVVAAAAYVVLRRQVRPPA